MKNILTAVFLISIVGPTTGGVKLVMETKSLSGPSQRIDWILIDGENRLRIDADVDPETGQAETSTIFRADLNTLYLLDHETREYLEINPERVRAMADQAAAAIAEAQKQAQDLPPGRREILEDLIKRNVPGASDEFKVEVRPAGQDDDKSRFEVWIGGKLRSEVWVQPPEKAGVSPDTMQVFAKFTTFYDELLATLRSNPLLQNLGNNPFPGFSKMGGVPVRISNLEEKDETRLIHAEQIELDPALFAPPTGYTVMEPEKDQ